MTEPTNVNPEPSYSAGIPQLLDVYQKLNKTDRLIFWHVACNMIKAAGLPESKLPIDAWAQAIVSYEEAAARGEIKKPEEK